MMVISGTNRRNYQANRLTTIKTMKTRCRAAGTRQLNWNSGISFAISEFINIKRQFPTGMAVNQELFPSAWHRYPTPSLPTRGALRTPPFPPTPFTASYCNVCSGVEVSTEDQTTEQNFNTRQPSDPIFESDVMTIRRRRHLAATGATLALLGASPSCHAFLAGHVVISANTNSGMRSTRQPRVGEFCMSTIAAPSLSAVAASAGVSSSSPAASGSSKDEAGAGETKAGDASNTSEETEQRWIKDMKAGQKVIGYVADTTNFAAFVDVGVVRQGAKVCGRMTLWSNGAFPTHVQLLMWHGLSLVLMILHMLSCY